VWRRVLREWLSWPEPRIEKFVSRFRTFVEPEWHSDRTPIFFLTHALLPPSLHQRYKGPGRIQIEKEIEAAVDQNYQATYLQPAFDWQAAQERVKAVLARYGAALPRPEDLTWWEREFQEKAGATHRKR